MATLRFLGHATFVVETDSGIRIAIDPYIEDNPACKVTRQDIGPVDFVFCTHGHADHFADAIPMAKETGATLVSTYEITDFAETQGIENVHPMHIGGSWEFPFGLAKMTPAVHGGGVFGDTTGRYSTVPGGFLFHFDGTRVYHAGDTGLTLDMKLLKGQVDVALLPIGDNFTMGPEDAAQAVKFIKPKVVVPMHYGTWPLIEKDPEDFRALVGDRAQVRIMAAGDDLAL